MKYRIAWRIGESTGHGNWLPKRDRLQHMVNQLRVIYGEETHWIESSSAAMDSCTLNNDHSGLEFDGSRVAYFPSSR